MSFLAKLVINSATRQVWPSGADGRLNILFYHRVLLEPDPLTPELMDAATFERQIKALASVFTIVPLEVAVEQLYSGTIKPLTLSISFDDGYMDNHEIAAPILKKHKLHATFYLTSGFMNGRLMYNDQILETIRRLPTGKYDFSWLGLSEFSISDVTSRRKLFLSLVASVKYLSSEQRDAVCNRLVAMVDGKLPLNVMMRAEHILNLHRSGMSIGGHTVDHPILLGLNDKDACSQIVRNRDDLADIIGEKPRLFAYPNGKPGFDYDTRHVGMVRDAGYSSAVSTSLGTAIRESDRFQLPRLSPWESSNAWLLVRIARMAWTGKARLADSAWSPNM